MSARCLVHNYSTCGLVLFGRLGRSWEQESTLQTYRVSTSFPFSSVSSCLWIKKSSQLLVETTTTTPKEENSSTDWYHQALDCQFAFLIKQWLCRENKPTQTLFHTALCGSTTTCTTTTSVFSQLGSAAAAAGLFECWDKWDLARMLGCNLLFFLLLAFFYLSLRLSDFLVCSPPLLFKASAIVVINIIIIVIIDASLIGSARGDEGAAGA